MKQDKTSLRNIAFLPIGVVIVVVLTILSGMLHGHMTRRWGASEDMKSVGRSIADFPRTVGTWQTVADAEMSDNVIRELECLGHWNRVYTDSETAESITAALLFGPSGPMTAHTPDICYSTQAFPPTGPPEPVTITSPGGAEGEFWMQTFKSSEIDGGYRRVYYAWRADGQWRASESARLTLARYPYLYKVQVDTKLSSGSEEDDAGKRFLSAFLDVAEAELQEL